MKKWFLKVLPFVAAVLGFDPEAKEKLELSQEDKDKLDRESGQEGFADAFMKYYNEQYAVDESSANQAYEEFMREFNATEPPVAGSENEGGEDEPEHQEVPKGDEKSLLQQLKAAVDAGKKLLQTNGEQAATIAKLKNLPDDDEPEAIVNTGKSNEKQMKHSKTHLFGSGQSYDGLDRPWNRAAADGKLKSATVWDKVNIDKLNEDLGAYSRRNSNEIMSMVMDGYNIPDHWFLISNVQDEFVFAQIASGEITQGFKKSFLPKNKQRFVPIKNKIFDKQIDITWQPSELKSIEKSWLNQFFNEGSTPYKMSFAAYLWNELLKQARKEDKISIFKGVYFDTENLPDGVSGSFLNSMDGYLKLVEQNRGVTYLAHDLPTLTPANTYDVIQDWVENKLPIDFKNLPGLKLQLGTDAHRWYVESRESKKGLIQDYQRNAMTVEKFPNIEFVAIPQLEGTGYMDIQPEGNCGLMIDRAGEEGMLTVETNKRAIDVFADYKQGVGFKAFGAKVDPNAALDYNDQVFFSNNVPLATETFVPVTANDATPSVKDHGSLLIGSNNTAATNITQLDDVVAGKTYILRGDSDANISTVKDGANILLNGDADFALNDGNEIVLIGLAGGKVIEYSRKVAGDVAEPEKVVLAADAVTADAADGTHFVTSANTGATAITNILNGVTGEVYTIEGGSNTNSSTIADGGNFLLTAAFSAAVGAYIKLKYNGSIFVEIERG